MTLIDKDRKPSRWANFKQATGELIHEMAEASRNAAEREAEITRREREAELARMDRADAPLAIDAKDVPELIRLARIERGVTVEELARMTGISAWDITSMERWYYARFEFDKLVAIKKALNISTDSIRKFV